MAFHVQITPRILENRRDLLANGITGFDGNLPISQRRSEIVRQISENSTVLVHGATGCGKTTQIPQYILDDCIRNGQMPYIVVTQPRRIAAISIARHVCDERNWEFGGLVGYQIGQDSLFCDETRILYCTLGVFLQKLVGGTGLDQMSHVILDEMHEREEEMDLALLLIKNRQKASRSQVKLVVMSATMEIKKFETYLGNPPVIEIATGMFDVDIKYLDDLTGYNGQEHFEIREPRVEGVAQDVLGNLLFSFDEQEKTGFKKSKGVVLIFVPGLREINSLLKSLEETSQTCGKNWEILPLHSTVSRRDQDRVFAHCPGNIRRIIVSTNIAESSITIPDVKYVLDFCLTKQVVRDESSAFTALRLSWASKSNCDQRKGRAGRLSIGTVYRLVPREFYARLDDHALPEMLRIPLHQTISKIKTLGIPGTIYEILLEAIDPPNPNAIRQSVLELIEAGALVLSDDCTNPELPDGGLTTIGRIMESLPLDLPLKRLIILAVAFGCVDEAVIIAGCLQSRSFLDVRFHSQSSDNYKMKMRWDRGGHSDLLAVLLAFQTWETQKSSVFGGKPDEERQWCNNERLSYPRINEAAILVDDIRRRVQEQGWYALYHPALTNNRATASSWTVHEGDVDQRRLLQFVIAGAFYPNFFTTEVEKGRRLNDNDPPCNPRMIHLAIDASPESVYIPGVKSFFWDHVGYRPETVICEDGSRICVTFGEDKDSCDPEVPLPVYLSLRLKCDRESANFKRVISEPSVSLTQKKIPFVPRVLAMAQKESPHVTSKHVPVTFSGPFSELEVLNFVGITPDIKFRKVRVSRSSVNSVIVNTCKDSRVARLLVAATVQAGEGTGQSLMIDNITLLPADPGTLDMIALVFAPTIHLVRNRRTLKMTGYRAGAGNTKSNPPLPLWSEHEIENSFEVDFAPGQISVMMSLREAWQACFADHLLSDGIWRLKVLPKFQSINRRMLHWLINQESIAY